VALPRLLGWPMMLPERMGARRAPPSREASGSTIVATRAPSLQDRTRKRGFQPDTSTRHVNPTPAAVFPLNRDKSKHSPLALLPASAKVRIVRQQTALHLPLPSMASTQRRAPGSGLLVQLEAPRASRLKQMLDHSEEVLKRG
jgi:hypothetical protein